MKDVSLDDLVEGVSLLTLELGIKHPESLPLLTLGQESLLVLLYRNNRMALKDLKASLNLNNFQMSRLLSSAEEYRDRDKKLSLIVREVHPEDKRQWIISLSEQGRRVFAEEFRRKRARLKYIFEPLTLREKADLISIIRKMVGILRFGKPIKRYE